MQSAKYSIIIVITVLPTQGRYMFQLVKGWSSGQSVQKCTQRKAILTEMSLYVSTLTKVFLCFFLSC